MGTNTSTNEEHKFYNSTVQSIWRGGGDWATSFGSMCDRFVDMGALVKSQVENGRSKIFGFRVHTIEVSDQAILP